MQCSKSKIFARLNFKQSTKMPDYITIHEEETKLSTISAIEFIQYLVTDTLNQLIMIAPILECPLKIDVHVRNIDFG